MPFITQHSVDLANRISNIVASLSAFTILVAVGVSMTIGTPYDIQETLSNPGVIIDFLALFFLLFMLWGSIRIALTNYAVYWIRYGLALWITGATIDLIDEVVIQPRWLSYCEDLVRLAGMLLTSVGLYKIIIKINELYARVKNESLHDELTMLPNRRFFMEIINKYNTAPHLSLMLIDIDHFKKINDVYGHTKGDEMLHELGKVLLSLSNDNTIASRIGGEEFAVITTGITKERLEVCAITILKQTNKIIINDQQPLSVSIGVGLKKSDESVGTFITRTDQALYKAKNNGRGRIEWSSD